MNVLRQTSIIGVLGIGMTFVILTAGIDLSVGATLALSAVLLAGTLESTGNMWLAMRIGIAAGMVVGLANGIGVTFGRVQPFVMTLGMLGIARSLAFLYTHGEPIPVVDMRFLKLGIGYLWRVPIPSVIFLVLLVVAALVLHYTPFGRYVYAIGSNEEAARLSGIDVRKVQDPGLRHLRRDRRDRCHPLLLAVRRRTGDRRRGLRTGRDRRGRGWGHLALRRARWGDRHISRRPDHRHPQQHPEPDRGQSLRPTAGKRRADHPRRLDRRAWSALCLRGTCVDLVTIGYLTLDDLVLDNDRVLRDTLGGGALFSAVGARTWNGSVGIHACSGGDYPNEYLDAIREGGIDVDGSHCRTITEPSSLAARRGGAAQAATPQVGVRRSVRDMDASRAGLPSGLPQRGGLSRGDVAPDDAARDGLAHPGSRPTALGSPSTSGPSRSSMPAHTVTQVFSPGSMPFSPVTRKSKRSGGLTISSGSCGISRHQGRPSLQ